MAFNLMSAAKQPARAIAHADESSRATRAAARQLAATEAACVAASKAASTAEFKKRKALFAVRFKSLMDDVVVPAELSEQTADVLCQVHARHELHKAGAIGHFATLHPAAWGAGTVAKRIPAWLYYADLTYICSWHNAAKCTYGSSCLFEHVCIACRGEHSVLDLETPPDGGEMVFSCMVMQELSDAGFDVLECDVEMLSQIQTKGTITREDCGTGAKAVSVDGGAGASAASEDGGAAAEAVAC